MEHHPASPQSHDEAKGSNHSRRAEDSEHDRERGVRKRRKVEAIAEKAPVVTGSLIEVSVLL